MFGRATIRLGIGPHSSCCCIYCNIFFSIAACGNTFVATLLFLSTACGIAIFLVRIFAIFCSIFWTDSHTIIGLLRKRTYDGVAPSC